MGIPFGSWLMKGGGTRLLLMMRVPCSLTCAQCHQGRTCDRLHKWSRWRRIAVGACRSCIVLVLNLWTANAIFFGMGLKPCIVMMVFCKHQQRHLVCRNPRKKQE